MILRFLGFYKTPHLGSENTTHPRRPSSLLQYRRVDPTYLGRGDHPAGTGRYKLPRYMDSPFIPPNPQLLQYHRVFGLSDLVPLRLKRNRGDIVDQHSHDHNTMTHYYALASNDKMENTILVSALHPQF